MGWFDSGFGDWFGSALGDYGSSGGGDSSGFDWGNVDLGSIFGDGNGSIGDVSGGGSGGSGGFNWGSLFGGSGSGSGSTGSNIFGALLGGLQGAAAAKLDEKTVKQAGIERRKSSAFEADLVDYYKQKDKARKRIGLDTYGQFSQLKRWAPNYQDTPAVDMPAKPNPTAY